MMKIVMLCSFSNSHVREHLDLKIPKIINWLYRVACGHSLYTNTDYGVWNTNAIIEFEKIKGIELHVITPCSFLKKAVQEFEIKGIHYHFFRDEGSTLVNMIYKQLVKPKFNDYKQNRSVIIKLINQMMMA